MADGCTPLHCLWCQVDLDKPALTAGDQHLCADCAAQHDAIMRDVEEHEARIADVPWIRMGGW